MTEFGKITLLMCFGFLGILLRGVALSAMWGWFVVPLGVPPIGIAHALGISVLAAFLTHQLDIEKAREKDPVAVVVEAIGGPTIILGIAWLVHMAMVG